MIHFHANFSKVKFGTMNDENENQENLNTKHNLNNSERASIIQFLLERSVNKILCHGAINEAAEAFNVHRSTIRRVWQRGLSSLDQGSTLMDASTMRKNCGRKKKNIQPQLYGIEQIPLHRRSSLRSTASALGVSLSTLHRRLKDGDFRKHNNIYVANKNTPVGKSVNIKK